MRRRLGLAALVAAALLACGASSASATRGLDLGILDPVYQSSDAGARQFWLDRTVNARANLVLLAVRWTAIEPAPGDYHWEGLDDAVRDATARGLKVMIVVSQAPPWAEGNDDPNDETRAPAYTWKPRTGPLENFGHAIAAHYSGAYPLVPRVKLFQLWAEPNLNTRLSPQFYHGHPVAPKYYRKMLNAFYKGVHSAKHGDKVVTGGTAPYGDLGRVQFRTPPVAFWRAVLCLRGHRLKPIKCKHPAHFDILAHHPIGQGRPERHARNPLDAVVPDMGKIKRVLRKAERTGRVRPKGHRPIWVTEIWYESKPPDPYGVSEATQARYLEQDLYLLWKQAIGLVIWAEIVDQGLDVNGTYNLTFQTGLFFGNGTPKLAYKAYRFPFVGDRLTKRKVRVWGKAPTAGNVSIQRKSGGSWNQVKSVHAGGSHVFLSSIHLRGNAKLRAVEGSEESLAWTQR
ncbi:MAG: beta-galactosidase [Chloroflexota bacterium]|nr:beta-galactosidase [Chloroflexota bacterium]